MNKTLSINILCIYLYLNRQRNISLIWSNAFHHMYLMVFYQKNKKLMIFYRHNKKLMVLYRHNKKLMIFYRQNSKKMSYSAGKIVFCSLTFYFIGRIAKGIFILPVKYFTTDYTAFSRFTSRIVSPILRRPGPAEYPRWMV